MPRAIMAANPYINNKGDTLLTLGFGIGGRGIFHASTRGVRNILSPGLRIWLSWSLVSNLIDAILTLSLVSVNNKQYGSQSTSFSDIEFFKGCFTIENEEGLLLIEMPLVCYSMEA